MIALATFHEEALDRPEGLRRRRVLDGWALAVAVGEETVVAGLVLLDLAKMVVGLGDRAVGPAAVAGVGR